MPYGHSGGSGGSAGGSGKLDDLADVLMPYPASEKDVLAFAGRPVSNGYLNLTINGPITVTAGVNDQLMIDYQYVTVAAGEYDTSYAEDYSLTAEQQRFWSAVEAAIQTVVPDLTLLPNGYGSANVALPAGHGAEHYSNGGSFGRAMFWGWPNDYAGQALLYRPAVADDWTPTSSYNLPAVQDLSGRVTTLENGGGASAVDQGARDTANFAAQSAADANTKVDNLTPRVTTLENAPAPAAAPSVGTGNTVTGTDAFAAGTNNTAAGTDAVALGQANNAAQPASFAHGVAARGDVEGVEAFASGRYTSPSVNARPQWERYVLRGETTGTETVALGGGPGGGGRPTTAFRLVRIKGTVMCRQLTDAGSQAYNTSRVWDFEVVVDNNGTVVKNVVTSVFAAAGQTAALALDGTTDIVSLHVNATGNGSALKWAGFVEVCAL